MTSLESKLTLDCHQGYLKSTNYGELAYGSQGYCKVRILSLMYQLLPKKC